MKKILLFLMLMLQMAVWNVVDAQGLTLSNVQNSGCLRENQRRANGDGQTRTIVLLKEGSILSVQLLNYEANCGTEYFDVTPIMSGSSDGTQCSVTIQVVPVGEEDMDCICPYNVSFTVYGLETNSFYFSCWWYEGQVSLTEGEPLTLEDISESINIDGVHYTLHKAMHTAKLANGKAKEGELIIPKEIYHEDVLYPVTRIEAYAFNGNSALTSVTIPNSVSSIGIAAFYRCSNLKDVYCYCEDKLPSTEGYTFTDTPVATATLHVPAGSIEKYKAVSPWNEFGNIVALPAVANEYIDPQTNVVYTYEPGQGTASVKAGYEEAQSTGFGEGEVFFYSGSPDAEGDIVILDRFSVGTEEYVVTRIGEGAFRENSKIKSVSIPETVTDIGKLAFCWCDSLTSVQLPSGLTKIAPWLFCCCNQLMSVTIPSSVSTIGERAFADCGSLANITLPESLTSIGYGVFSNCYFVADSFINKSTLTSSNKWGATLCDMETSEGLMLKDNGVVFCRPWTWINSVTIPNGVTSIEKNAFMDRSGLTSVTIPYSVTSIGEDAFLRCFGLSSVTIPSSVTKIGNSAFCLCYGLTSVTIGSGMASIGAGAFYECRNLRNVCCYAEDVPDTGINTFEGLPIASATLHVPAGSVDSYKAVSPWNEFGNIVAIEKIAKEYFPEGTKWTEIRLDTLKYDSWYSKVGDEWMPNFETIEYRVEGKYTDHITGVYHCVYTNGPEWTDSLALLIHEGLYSNNSVEVSVPYYYSDSGIMWPGEVYQFDWSIGKGLYYRDIQEANSTGAFPIMYFYGIIDEIKEGYFGGVRPLKYADLDGKAPDKSSKDWDFGYTDTDGGRVIQGIGITEWNDGECLFGPPNPYFAMTGSYNDRHYRSMLVHFERDGEVLYDVWPEKESAEAEPVIFTQGQMATIILPTAPDASKGKYYRLDRVENGQIIFEQELLPQAHVPYIIMPSEDFSIDPSTLDLEGLSNDTVSIDGISFIGTYGREELPDYTGGSFYIDIIDTTPDCTPLLGEGQGERLFIGALRAWLQVNWDDPIDHGGAKSPEEKKQIVLKDNPDGIEGNEELRMKNEELNAVYDLSGRRIDSSLFTLRSSLKKGIYIEDGKKKVTK